MTASQEETPAPQPDIPPDNAKTSQQTIILTGGGSGGHITPILAVAHELKKLRADTNIIYVGERRGKFANLTKDNPDIDEIRTIFAGKFRRYHGESWLRRLADFRTNAQNLRDTVYVLIGFFQSLRLISQINPDKIFLKGGYVGMPMGLAGAMKHKILITHDSDAVPGLANRVISRWVKYHATALPAEYYKYPKEAVRHVGVLVADEYKPVTPVTQKQFKIDLQLSPSSKMLLVTGGSLGARRINLTFVKLAPELIERFFDLDIVHQVGKGNTKTYGEFKHPRLHVVEFMEPMHRYTGAADLVVTRAGANTLAELGMQGKATIVIPNPQLTGGHQIKNAEFLKQQGAAEVVSEDKIKDSTAALEDVIEELLGDGAKRIELGANLQALTIPDAANRLALLLIEAT